MLILRLWIENEFENKTILGNHILEKKCVCKCMLLFLFLVNNSTLLIKEERKNI
jgi:hypothetical protein